MLLFFIIFKWLNAVFFFFGCTESLLLHTGFLYLQWLEATKLPCTDLSLWWLLLLQGTGSEVVALSLVVWWNGIFLTQGLKPHPLHWQADS